MSQLESERQNIQNRWTPDLTILGNRALIGKGSPPFLNLADGRRDLRGLTISEIVKNVTVSDCDLSGCVAQRFGQFSFCHVLRCSFRQAKLKNNLDHNFQDCDFADAKLAGMVLRGKFVRCNFAAANLSSVMGTQIQFIDCTFIKTNFRKAILTHCLFEKCDFTESKFGSGSFGRSRFVECQIASDTLGSTIMDKVVIC
jgi:uncharacterized protein YjbI with pentapeptide repeats